MCELRLEFDPGNLLQESDEASFAFRIWILNGYAKGIPERLLGVREADAVFAQV